jgi:hypothetical protein
MRARAKQSPTTTCTRRATQIASMECRAHCNSPPFHSQCIGLRLTHSVDCFVAPPHVPARAPRNDGLNEKQSPDYNVHKRVPRECVNGMQMGLYPPAFHSQCIRIHLMHSVNGDCFVAPAARSRPAPRNSIPISDSYQLK